MLINCHYNQIAWMKFKMPSETIKAKLIDYHKETYPHRHAWVMNSKPSGTEILNEYPRSRDCDTEALVSFCSIFNLQPLLSYIILEGTRRFADGAKLGKSTLCP